MEVRKNVRDPFGNGIMYSKILRDEFVLSVPEAKIIADLLRTKKKVLENRFEKYFGLFEAGEATDRDTDELDKVKEQIETIEEFIHLADYQQLKI